MLNQSKSNLNFRILKFLLITPLLVIIPTFTNTSDLRAGLEFQWDQNTGYKRLKWFQKENQRRFRNTIYFFLRPNDRGNALLKINLDIPRKFQTKIKKEKISFCRVNIGGFESRTKCLEIIPADIEIKEDNSSIDIFPYKPIPFNKESYAIVLKANNPSKTGLYQFHSFGQPAGQSISTYLGSWTIVID